MAAGERGLVVSGRDDRTYTPVSGLAVTAFVFALAAAGALVVVWIGARRSGKPAQYPLLLVPQIVALVLGLFAVRRVRSADGTLSGMRLANAAWIIALVFGGSFAATLVATELAIRNQAEQFTFDWFDKIVTQPAEISFLQTLDPMNRQTIDPNDITAIAKRFGSDLHNYKASEVYRLLQRAGKQYEAHSRGLKGWDMVDGGYFVVQVIELRTAEGKFEVEVPVMGRDIPNLGRAWQIQGPKVGVVGRQTTALGRLLIDVQYDARRFLSDWTQHINTGNIHEAYLETLPVDQRRASSQPNEQLEHDKAAIGDIIMIDGSPPTPEQKAKYAAALIQPAMINLNPGSQTHPPGPPLLDFSPDGQLHIHQLTELSLSTSVGDGVVAVITADLIDSALQACLNELRGGDWKKLPLLPGNKQLSTQEIDKYPQRTYRISKVDIRPKAQRLPQNGP